MRRLPRLLSALLAAALCTAAGLSDGPLTEEDVVRMVVAGRPADEILREIERRDPDYDLSPEMLEELRRIDLPEPLIDAMTRRQESKRQAEARAAEQAPPVPLPVLRLRLNPARAEHAGTIGLRARVDPELAAEWELGNAPEDRVFADLALFLVCQTPDHVPDQWRLKSPLGRDFLSMPRHRVLEFIAGASGEAAAELGSRVRVELPTEIEVTLEPGVAHDLMLGLALQVGGRYRAVISDTWPDAVIGDKGLDLSARVTGHSLRTLEARFLHKREDAGETDPDENDERASRGSRAAPPGGCVSAVRAKAASRRPALPW